MDDFTARMSVKAALQLYVFLEAREAELEGGPGRLYTALRSYLYENLSIQDMEQPEIFLDRLDDD